ncbi:type II toxin-antitoxin system YhaV family toxin [Serratia proteamaculans]|uniref:type II toxin-antitoxin system YhaV family toxin n=1 Tax=Serratia proteamaculans TaxID=28151 RepID=UPI0039BDB2CA
MNRYNINGWYIVAHPLFIQQIEDLVAQVELLKKKNPDTYKSKNVTKRLAAIRLLILDDISRDPTQSKFRQGDTLSDSYKHWFRAKFYQQYRLFFRYDSNAKVIIIAWVNDDTTLRAYGSKSDAYKVFKGMLDSGIPPDDWDTLLAKCLATDEKQDKQLSEFLSTNDTGS